MQRREFFGAGLGAAGGVWCGALGQDPQVRPGPPDAAAMANVLLRTPAGDVVGLGLSWLRSGVSPRELLAAALLAGVEEIDPSPIGGPVHAIMMVASASWITGLLRGEDTFLPALFNLSRVKRSQERDRARADWRMPAPPAGDERPTRALTTDFHAAMAAWDVDAADRLAVGLHRCLAVDEFFELLWPWAMRDFRVIGHKAIHAAQAHRALDDLGWRAGRDVVRSVLFGVLDANPYGSATEAQTRAILDLFVANRQRCAALDIDADAAADPAASRALHAELRSKDAAAAGEVLAAAARSGAGERTLWDAVRLRAFEQTLRLPTIAGVHPVTSVNALRHIAGQAREPMHRRVALLQAASWLGLFEELVRARVDPQRDGLRIEAVVPADRGDPFDAGTEGERRVRAVRMVADGDGETFAVRAAGVLARKAGEDHDYKFAAAALEEMAAAAPELAPGLAGAAMAFLRSERDPDSDVCRAVGRRG